MSNIAQNIRTLRKSRHLSQQELADRMSTSKQVISRYERGERDPKTGTLLQLASVLAVSVQELTGELPSKTHLPVSASHDKMRSIIKALRIQHDLTQQELADIMGLSSRSTVAKWEKGVSLPKTREIIRLAEILGCTVADLYDEAPADNNLLQTRPERQEPETYKKEKEGENAMTVGERIRELREKKNMTVEMMADLTGINKGTLYRYQNGNDVNAAALRRIAAVLGVEPWEIDESVMPPMPESKEANAIFNKDTRGQAVKVLNEIATDLEVTGQYISHAGSMARLLALIIDDNGEGKIDFETLRRK